MNKKIYGLVLILGMVCMDINIAAKESKNTNKDHNSVNKALLMNVFKSPTCGCCNDWITHIKKHGYSTQSHHPANMSELKTKLGIAGQFRSCHTAVSADGYIFEGHVPARYIKQFLKAPPEGAIGLSVPAMPVGSPGMENQDKFMPYNVLLLRSDNTSEIYARIKAPGEQY